MHPLKLKPVFKDYIWGGDKLVKDFNKVSSMEKIAESWELSCHKDGQSIILNGKNKNTLLSDFIEKNGRENVLGTKSDKFSDFPILIKLIDAKDDLSVQVHPCDEYALRVEKEYGKTEMWYIVDCDEGASLLYGFNRTITEDEFKLHIENNTLLDVCNKVNVKKGDVFFIDAGTLHAIGKGIVIAEIQQNSNTTYRIYDYGRVGVDNKPRELHVQKALEVTNLKPVIQTNDFINKETFFDGYTQNLLAECEYFTVYKLDIEEYALLNCDETSFQSLLVLDGEFELDYGFSGMKIKKGDSVFIPANIGEYQLTGFGEVILSRI